MEATLLSTISGALTQAIVAITLWLVLVVLLEAIVDKKLGEQATTTKVTVWTTSTPTTKKKRKRRSWKPYWEWQDEEKARRKQARRTRNEEATLKEEEESEELRTLNQERGERSSEEDIKQDKTTEPSGVPPGSKGTKPHHWTKDWEVHYYNQNHWRSRRKGKILPRKKLRELNDLIQARSSEDLENDRPPRKLERQIGRAVWHYDVGKWKWYGDCLDKTYASLASYTDDLMDAIRKCEKEWKRDEGELSPSEDDEENNYLSTTEEEEMVSSTAPSDYDGFKKEDQWMTESEDGEDEESQPPEEEGIITLKDNEEGGFITLKDNEK
jgi:hypothetical protein